ncbi:MAG: hypothetical protein IJ417_00970 [Bacteroidaceae bacterium]|nr:hypothetical protein [Bacteroidaceae bacterium]
MNDNAERRIKKQLCVEKKNTLCTSKSAAQQSSVCSAAKVRLLGSKNCSAVQQIFMRKPQIFERKPQSFWGRIIFLKILA